MTDNIEIIKALAQHASVTSARSTTLKAIHWMLLIMFPSTIGSFAAKAPTWASIVLFAMTGAVLVVGLFAYLYLLFTDPDALRSERYVLTKSIHKAFVGDSVTGLFEKPAELLALPGPESDQEKGK